MRKKILIAIDDGHGMETAGKRTPAFSDGRVMKENEFNRAVAAYLAEELEKNGFATLPVAPGDTDVPLKTRVTVANEKQADAYISIHANAFGSAWNEANGIETWIYEKVMGDSETYRFARYIHDALLAATGRRSRGIKRSHDLYVLKNTRMHAALVECGFMTNAKEAALLLSEDYRRECAAGICKGICSFYGVTYKEKEAAGVAEKRYNTIAEVPTWAQALIKEMQEKGCFGNPTQLNLSEDMLRTMVLTDRLWKAREGQK